MQSVSVSMRKLYLWLLLIVGGSLFLYFLLTLNWREALRVISKGNPVYLAIYLIASVSIRVLQAVRWQVVLQAKNVHIPFWKALSYRTAGAAVSFVTPGPKVGGEAVTAGLLSRDKIKGRKVKFSKGLSTLVIDRSVELQTFAGLFFICVMWLAFHHAIPGNLQFVMVALAVLLFSVILLLAINVQKGQPYMFNFAKKFAFTKNWRREVKHFEETIVSFYRQERPQFIATHVIAVVAWFLSFIEFKYLLLLLGYDVPLYGIFIIYSFVGFAYLLPIPLALGTLETSQAAAFSLLGLQAGAGLILALITRLRDIIFTLIGFMILVYHGIAPRTLSTTVR
jgi:glycosyltransferase 2 family protein